MTIVINNINISEKRAPVKRKLPLVDDKGDQCMYLTH